MFISRAQPEMLLFCAKDGNSSLHTDIDVGVHNSNRNSGSLDKQNILNHITLTNYARLSARATWLASNIVFPWFAVTAVLPQEWFSLGDG